MGRDIGPIDMTVEGKEGVVGACSRDYEWHGDGRHEAGAAQRQVCIRGMSGECWWYRQAKGCWGSGQARQRVVSTACAGRQKSRYNT